MTPLHKLLPAAQGSDLIQKCWGEMPCFDGWCEVLHVSQIVAGSAEHEILLTGFFGTSESDIGNDCKPSRMVIRFSGVAAWECDYFAVQNGIRSAEIFGSPPAGCVVIEADNFRIVCQTVTILSCEHDPLIDHLAEQRGSA